MASFKKSVSIALYAVENWINKVILEIKVIKVIEDFRN